MKRCVNCGRLWSEKSVQERILKSTFYVANGRLCEGLKPSEDIAGESCPVCGGIVEKAAEIRKDVKKHFVKVELGASTESNVCALAVDLAMQNRITLAELLTKLL